MAEYTEYQIQRETLVGIADQARRLGSVTEELSPKQIEQVLSRVTPSSDDSNPSASTGPFCKVAVVADASNLIKTTVNVSAIVNIQTPSYVEYYYNRKQLPEIPAEVLANYPYAVLIVSTDGSMWLWLSTEKMYVAKNDNGVDRLNIPANCVYCGFNADANVWLMQYAYTTDIGYSVNGFASWSVWWTNHDIHIGSADSGEIYFPVSQPQKEQPADATHYYYNGVRLPAIPEDVLAEYPYVFIGLVQSTGRYQILASVQPMYFGNNGYISRQNGNTEPFIHCAEGDNVWTAGTSGNYGWSITTDRILVWSNHDLPNGSATATEIYFSGTYAVPDPN